jgi:apolipoprotein N-acyltransferase
MYFLFSAIFGTILTLAFAPLNYIIAGLYAFPAILLLTDFAVQKGKNPFWIGFGFGFGHHVSGLYWISNSLLVEAEKFAWMIPFAASLIPAYLAIYTGFVFWLTYRLKYEKTAKILFFGGTWVLMEIVRSYALTGFPWNLLGYTMLESQAISQVASVLGVYGLSLIAIILFCAPYLVLRALLDFDVGNRVYRAGYSFIYLTPLILILIIISMWGEKRLVMYSGSFENTMIRIVQPNIPQKEKFDPLRFGDHIYRYVSLTVTDPEYLDFVPDLIIWPEAATVFTLEEEEQFVKSLSDIIPYSSHLILGSIRRKSEGSYNSIEVIDHDGILVEDLYYNKHHLVPFGEYVPLRKFLPGIERITHGQGDFNTGSGPMTMVIENKPPFAPSICYEIIFPGEVAPKKYPQNIVKGEFEKKPEWILNVTNDGWFGITSGPHQHLDKARVRAIEEGLPVVRSANSGISAFIDAYGYVVDRIELGEQGVIDSKLPSAHPEDTYFSTHGLKSIIQICGLFILIAACVKFCHRILT